MRSLASYILKGPLQAALAAAVPALISMYAPYLFTLLLVYFSGAVIALVTLRLGMQKGFLILIAASVGAAISAYGLIGHLQARLDYWNAVYMWLLVWVAGGVLASTRSLAWSLETICLGSVIAIVAFLLLVNEPVATWLKVLEVLRPVLSQAETGWSAADVDRMLQQTATVATGSLATYTALGAMVALMIGRSWQASLFNPGGLKQEFRGLRLGKLAGGLTLALLLALVFAERLGEDMALLLANVSITVGLLYVVAGLGLAHGLLAGRDNATVWLVGLYILLVLFNKVVAPVLMLLALTDIWADYRSRLRKAN